MELDEGTSLTVRLGSRLVSSSRGTTKEGSDAEAVDRCCARSRIASAELVGPALTGDAPCRYGLGPNRVEDIFGRDCDDVLVGVSCNEELRTGIIGSSDVEVVAVVAVLFGDDVSALKVPELSDIRSMVRVGGMDLIGEEAIILSFGS